MSILYNRNPTCVPNEDIHTVFIFFFSCGTLAMILLSVSCISYILSSSTLWSSDFEEITNHHLNSMPATWDHRNKPASDRLHADATRYHRRAIRMKNVITFPIACAWDILGKTDAPHLVHSYAERLRHMTRAKSIRCQEHNRPPTLQGVVAEDEDDYKTLTDCTPAEENNLSQNTRWDLPLLRFDVSLEAENTALSELL